MSPSPENMSTARSNLANEKCKSSMWWLGQTFSAFLGICSIGASGSITVGLVVFFALGVLVDIRELLSSK